MSQPGKKITPMDEEVNVAVKYLKEGSRLHYDCYTEDGQLVLPSHTPFTQEKINELLVSRIENIYYNKGKRDTLSSKQLADYLEKESYQGPRSVSINTQKKGVSAMDRIVKMIRNQEDVDFYEARDFVESVLHDLKHSNEEIVNLLALEIYDDYTYIHSVNTGVITMALAKHMGKTDEEIIEIGLGGFLHDIGKLNVPYDLLNKKDRLTPEEFSTLKQHSVFGFEMVKEDMQLTESVKDMILLHHERFDGTGYPFQFKGDDISDEVYMVAVAEAFDALTTDHPYQEAKTSQQSLHRIMEAAGLHFKKDIARFFVQNMGHLLKENYYCPIGTYVILNTKEVARVQSENKEMPLRPDVLILIQNGKRLAKPLPVQLKMDGSREIVRALNDADAQQLKNRINID